MGKNRENGANEVNGQDGDGGHECQPVRRNGCNDIASYRTKEKWRL